MIIDSIGKASLYHCLGPRIEVALRYLESTDFSELEPRRYDVIGDECYALVQHYETKPEDRKKWEAHRRYIDVQYVASGIERIGYADIGAMDELGEYDESKDAILPQGTGEFLTLRPGTFVILYPQDVHKPGVAAGSPGAVQKVVMKVMVAS